MTDERIMEQLEDIFRDLFDDEEIKLTERTTAADIEDWDSLMNMQLIATVEEVFNIHFTLGEINGFSNFGEIRDCVSRHLGR